MRQSVQKPYFQLNLTKISKYFEFLTLTRPNKSSQVIDYILLLVYSTFLSPDIDLIFLSIFTHFCVNLF